MHVLTRVPISKVLGRVPISELTAMSSLDPRLVLTRMTIFDYLACVPISRVLILVPSPLVH